MIDDRLSVNRQDDRNGKQNNGSQNQPAPPGFSGSFESVKG